MPATDSSKPPRRVFKVPYLEKNSRVIGPSPSGSLEVASAGVAKGFSPFETRSSTMARASSTDMAPRLHCGCIDVGSARSLSLPLYVPELEQRHEHKDASCPTAELCKPHHAEEEGGHGHQKQEADEPHPTLYPTSRLPNSLIGVHAVIRGAIVTAKEGSQGRVSTSIMPSHLMACSRLSPHISAEGCSVLQTAGRSGLLNSAHRSSGSNCTHRTPAGLPSAMPGMGLEIEGAMQHAAQRSRHFMSQPFG